MSKETLKRLLTKYKDELEKKFGVSELGFFGSYAQQKQKKGSDLDILVEFNKTPGFFKFIELEDYLTKKLKIKVDLVRKKAVRKELKDNILKTTIFV